MEAVNWYYLNITIEQIFLPPSVVWNNWNNIFVRISLVYSIFIYRYLITNCCIFSYRCCRCSYERILYEIHQLESFICSNVVLKQCRNFFLFLNCILSFASLNCFCYPFTDFYIEVYSVNKFLVPLLCYVQIWFLPAPRPNYSSWRDAYKE